MTYLKNVVSCHSKASSTSDDSQLLAPAENS